MTIKKRNMGEERERVQQMIPTTTTS